jgi:hypothetical protein
MQSKSDIPERYKYTGLSVDLELPFTLLQSASLKSKENPLEAGAGVTFGGL